MKTITNQNIYQCEHCDKRFLSKSGARQHEKQYCSVLNEQLKKELQEQCKHEDTHIVYSVMAGENYAMEPDYEVCVDCGINVTTLRFKKATQKGGA